MSSPSRQRLPTRSRKFGVGKEIGGAVYVHRSYEGVLGDAVVKAKDALPENFDYHVVKLVVKTGAVSFIECSEFNTADEPALGAVITVQWDGKSSRRDAPLDPYIYHHKWLFVEDDYSGFDIEASKKRSITWMSLSEVDTRRIGKRSYWESEVIPRISSLDDESNTLPKT